MKLFLLLCSLTVTIHTSKVYKNHLGEDEIGLSTCTGVFISDNEILTAGHCSEHSRGYQWVLTHEGVSYPAEIIKIDSYRDLALLRVPKIKRHRHTQIKKEAYKTEDVYSVNSGKDFIETYAKGVVQNFVSIDESLPDMTLHSAAILPGASGSGLFDEKGNLVGINTRAAGPFSMAVTTKDILYFMAHLNDITA